MANIYRLEMTSFKWASLLSKQQRIVFSVLYNPSQRILIYHMDFFRDFLFEPKKGVWLISINLRFQVSPQKKILGSQIWRGHQIQRINGQKMPLSIACRSFSGCVQSLVENINFACLTLQVVAINILSTIPCNFIRKL